MATVINTTKRLIRVHPMGGRSTSTKLVPGRNEVDDRALADMQKHPQVKRLFDTGTLTTDAKAAERTTGGRDDLRAISPTPRETGGPVGDPDRDMSEDDEEGFDKNAEDPIAMRDAGYRTTRDGEDDDDYELRDYGDEEVVRLVEQEDDHERLEEWSRKEQRPTVREAIKTRLRKLVGG